MKYCGKVVVTLKPGVFDPQGMTIKNALHTLSYQEVEEVETGKYFRIILKAVTKEEAERRVQEMCERLLANPVIERYTFEVEEFR
ncbi:MAG: phosphoribosylformylglycinamidine synthase subunit PurS [Atribacterota bacterium]